LKTAPEACASRAALPVFDDRDRHLADPVATSPGVLFEQLPENDRTARPAVPPPTIRSPTSSARSAGSVARDELGGVERRRTVGGAHLAMAGYGSHALALVQDLVSFGTISSVADHADVAALKIGAWRPLSRRSRSSSACRPCAGSRRRFQARLPLRRDRLPVPARSERRTDTSRVERPARVAAPTVRDARASFFGER